MAISGYPPDSSGGTGSVTSVGLTTPSILSVAGSPITAAGTLAVTLANQASSLVFAGPASGATTTPTFRALVGTDLNTFTNLMPATIATSTQLGTITDGYSTQAAAIKLTTPDGTTAYTLHARSTDNILQLKSNAVQMVNIFGSSITMLIPLDMNSSAVSNVSLLTTSRLKGGSTAPTIAPGTGAGTSGTTSLLGTDLSGTITINTVVADTPAANAVIATITFNTTYAAAPRIIISPSSDTSGNLISGVVRCRQTDVTTTTFTLRSGPTALPATTTATYTFNYMVIQ